MTHRRLPLPRQLHPSTWVVGAVVTAVLVLLIVPGKPPGKIRFDVYLYQQEYGWPKPYLNRWSSVPDPSRRGVLGIPWTIPAAWDFTTEMPGLQDDEPGVLWSCLVYDGLLGLLILLLIAGLWEWRIRRVGGLLRFRMSDLLAGMLVVGIACAWWAAWSRGYQAEEAALRAESLSDARNYREQSYCGPDWLNRLVGTELLPPVFDRTVRACLYVGKLADPQAFYTRLKRQACLDDLSLYFDAAGPDRDRQLHRLADQPRLRRLWLSLKEPTDRDVQQLAQLGQLTSLGIYQRLSREQFDRLRDALPGCEIHAELKRQSP